MAQIIYEQSYHIILHCEECGIMQGSINADFFEPGGHLADYEEIRTPTEARRAQRTHQKWHDALEIDTSKDGRDQDGGCPWCGRDCPDAGKPEGCWYQGCPDFPHGE